MIPNLASTLLGFVVQIHVFHWLTSSYSQHKALGKLYENIHEMADEFVEKYMGKYGKNIGTSSASVITYNSEDLMEVLNSFEQFLIGLTSELTQLDTDLLNVRDDMLGELHRAKYLLTLK
jgi:DNA-binding ferritin-like protein